MADLFGVKLLLGWNTPSELLRCESCSKFPAKNGYAQTEHAWLIKMFCCGNVWYNCTICATSRSRITTDNYHRPVRRHRTKHPHAQPPMLPVFGAKSVDVVGAKTVTYVFMTPNDNNTVQDNDDVEMGDADLLHPPDSPRTQMPVPPASPEAFKRVASGNFFENDLVGKGELYLCQQAQLQNSLMLPESSWDGEDVELSLKIARMCMNLSRQQKERFADILNLTVIQTEKNLTARQHKPFCPAVPRSFPMLRKQIMEGKHAILPNLPHPSIRKHGDDIAYTSIIECIQDLFAHGIPIEQIMPRAEAGVVTKASESERAQEIHENAITIHGKDGDIAIIPLIEWADDHESNQVKTERSSGVFKKTLTISPKHGTPHPVLYTYPLVIGPKGADYTEVELFHNEELDRLSRKPAVMIFSKEKKRVQGVHGEMFAALQDQPQRRSQNAMQQGNSKRHACFGYNYPYHYEWQSVPSCSSCQADLQMKGFRDDNCQHCKSWKLSGKFKLSYDHLKDAATKVYDDIVSGKMPVDDANRLLASVCINDREASKIVEHATNRATLNQVAEEGILEVEYPELARMLEESPELFLQCAFPPAWSKRNFKLWQNVEAIMHLIFLGLCKATMRLSNKWCTCLSKWPPFLDYIAGVPESVERLSLEWCKAKSYGTSGKFGGQVSENFIANCRLLPWMYSKLDCLRSEEPFVPPPNIPWTRWIMKTNKKWLQVRGLDTEGKAADLKERVAMYMTREEGPPDVLPLKGGPVAFVEMVTMSLLALVSRLMQRRITEMHVKSVERHIAIFLDSFERMEKEIRPSDKLPGFVRKYNFACLPNIVFILRKFGNLRDLWEGGVQGEETNQETKAILHHTGLRKNWAFNTLQTELRKGAFRRMGHVEHLRDPTTKTVDDGNTIGEGTSSDSARGGTSSSEIVRREIGRSKSASAHANSCRSDCNVYDFMSLQRQWQKGLPISCIQYLDGTFRCCLKKKFEVKIQPGEHQHHKMGFHYFTWTMDAQPSPLCDVPIFRHVLLLPRLSERGLPDEAHQDDVYYTAIADDWTVMLEDKSMNFFRIPGFVYDASFI